MCVAISENLEAPSWATRIHVTTFAASVQLSLLSLHVGQRAQGGRSTGFGWWTDVACRARSPRRQPLRRQPFHLGLEGGWLGLGLLRIHRMSADGASAVLGQPRQQTLLVEEMSARHLPATWDTGQISSNRQGAPPDDAGAQAHVA